MLRKALSVLILVPLAILLVAFAVANRGSIVVSFDPFDPLHPAYAVPVPLFALILGLVIAGVIIGGVAAWLRQSKWRRTARLAQARARELAAELDRLKRATSPIELTASAVPAGYAPRLTIPPPVA
jgi:uncharacterized integral membrane protein